MMLDLHPGQRRHPLAQKKLGFPSRAIAPAVSLSALCLLLLPSCLLLLPSCFCSFCHCPVDIQDESIWLHCDHSEFFFWLVAHYVVGTRAEMIIFSKLSAMTLWCQLDRIWNLLETDLRMCPWRYAQGGLTEGKDLPFGWMIPSNRWPRYKEVWEKKINVASLTSPPPEGACLLSLLSSSADIRFSCPNWAEYQEHSRVRPGLQHQTGTVEASGFVT